MRWFATQAALSMALIWALRESSRLPFHVKECAHRRKFYLKRWEDTEFTGGGPGSKGVRDGFSQVVLCPECIQRWAGNKSRNLEVSGHRGGI